MVVLSAELLSTEAGTRYGSSSPPADREREADRRRTERDGPPVIRLRRARPHGVLAQIDEDGEFGAQCLELEGRLYSRDLVESANEINFLLDHLPRRTCSRCA